MRTKPTRLASLTAASMLYGAIALAQDQSQAQALAHIPFAQADLEIGEEINETCASCHGSDGMGKQDQAVPMIGGQYTNYLWRQVDKYLSGERIHDPDAPDDELLAAFDRAEIRDILA